MDINKSNESYIYRYQNVSVTGNNTNIGSNNTIAADDVIEVIVRFSGDIEKIATELQCEIEILYQGYAIITIDRMKVPLLYSYNEIVHIELPKRLSFEISQNLSPANIRKVQTNPPVLDLTGKDVIVAIIDSGIDYLHEDFRNEDGSSRILYIWDQTGIGTPPEGFTSGAEYNNEQINQAINSEHPYEIVAEVDTNGHGTAVAGIAVGNGRASNGKNIGVAPEADIISVKIGTKGYESFAKTTELMRAIKYVIEKAKELKKPLAINISFGTNNGSHNGDSLFETYINSISTDWEVVIVVPTGNEGSAGHHCQEQINSFEMKEIIFFTAPGIDSFYITLWKDFVDIFSVELIFPSGKTSGIASLENQVQTSREENTIINIFYGQPTNYSSSQEVFFDVKTIEGTLASGLWKIRITSGNIVSGKVDMWLPTIEAVTDQTFFANSETTNTLTIPSTAMRVITVAGYNDRLGSISDFSGRGKENSLITKPDVTAPAVGVISTKNGGGYDSFTGTSMAAPFVTGTAAVMMQWGIVNKNDPFLYGERIKAFLRLGAIRTQNRQYPNIYWGYGELCIEQTMRYLQIYKWGGWSKLWQMI